jgi:2,4-dienoyl-CoA reductase (NADPH2)
VRNGDRADMRCCISCENCIDSMIRFQNLNCAVNAASGREETNVLTAAETRKRVVVVGGGAAGLEVARVADLRGHEVILLERQKRLGGSLLLASTVHSDNEPFYHWLVGQVSASGVDVRMGQEADAALLASLQPDALVIATGARVETPDIAGADQPHVFSGAQLRRLVEGQAGGDDFGMLPGILRGPADWLMQRVAPWLTPKLLRQLTRIWLPLGKRIVVVGADLAALEVAEFLANRGRKVIVLEAGKRIASEIGPKRLAEHMDRLDRLGVSINTEAVCDSITVGAVHYHSVGGTTGIMPADSVILAGEPVADTRLHQAVMDMAPEVHAIGDCTGLGLIQKATEEGMRVACAL